MKWQITGQNIRGVDIVAVLERSHRQRCVQHTMSSVHARAAAGNYVGSVQMLRQVRHLYGTKQLVQRGYSNGAKAFDPPYTGQVR